MTRNETLLKKLADWHPPATGRHILAVPDEGSGWTVTLTADRCDALGCLVWELVVRRSTPATATGGNALSAWAERIAGRVTGLLEPLKVVEVDVGRDEALLRSDTPAQCGDKRFYYEVHLRGTGQAVVRRYQGTHQPGARREQVAFALTHEALAKLAGDLMAQQ
jgi:hypothetical protein